MTASSPLRARRRDATASEIALAAAQLFAERGVGETTVEQIAARAGVSLRTFYRYCRTKADAVAPLLTVGAESWQAALAAAPAGTKVVDAVEAAIGEAFTISGPNDPALAEWTRSLVRAVASDIEMAAVWFRVNGESEARVSEALAHLVPRDTAAIDIRLIAAAATSAIRVALEAWAQTETDFVGDAGPAAMAKDAFRQLVPPRFAG